jgi:iron donor protein CyaY
MTESLGNEPGSALFARIRHLVNERGVDIRLNQSGNALRLEFADGQRILVNFDAQTHNVWLAARSGGIEFIHRDGTWRAHDQSELFARLRETIELTIAGNPLNARAPSGTQAPQSARPDPVVYYEAKESHWLRNLLIVLLAAVLGFWVAQRPSQTPMTTGSDAPAQAETVSLNQLDPGQQCEGGFPANGTITFFPEGGLHAGGPNDTEIMLKNDHAHPVLLIFSAPQTAIPAMSVLVHARQSTTLYLPAGQYDMMFGVGTLWCNPRRGFSDGHILKFDQSDRPVQLALQSSGAGMDDFQLFVRTAAPEAELPLPTFSGDGSMEVRRHANGHFYLPGSIENVPVTFMVDTGASVTSISSDLARQAGIRNCREVQFQTANGPATGCIALVPRMTLGNFVLQNITVAVMPNMETNLLGANVLRNFQVSQSDSSMLIGRR